MIVILSIYACKDTIIFINIELEVVNIIHLYTKGLTISSVQYKVFLFLLIIICLSPLAVCLIAGSPLG